MDVKLLEGKKQPAQDCQQAVICSGVCHVLRPRVIEEGARRRKRKCDRRGSDSFLPKLPHSRVRLRVHDMHRNTRTRLRNFYGDKAYHCISDGGLPVLHSFAKGSYQPGDPSLRLTWY
jgi:hypothetical protein